MGYVPIKWDMFMFRKGEFSTSSPSNSQRPGYSFELVKNQRVGLNTPMIYPEHIAKAKSAFCARLPHNRQYFLVHSYKLGLSH